MTPMLAIKILHLWAMAIGLGGGVASAIMMVMAGAENRPITGPIQARLGWVSFAALIVLWITGLLLVQASPFLAGGMWFWAKMVAVAVLTIAAVTMRIKARNPGPHTPALAKRLGMIITAAAAIAAALAVIAFS